MAGWGKLRVVSGWIGKSSLEMNRARIYTRLRSPGIDSKESIPPAYVAWRARQIGLSFRPTRLHRLAESIPRIDSWTPETFTKSGSDEPVQPEAGMEWYSMYLEMSPISNLQLAALYNMYLYLSMIR